MLTYPITTEAVEDGKVLITVDDFPEIVTESPDSDSVQEAAEDAITAAIQERFNHDLDFPLPSPAKPGQHSVRLPTIVSAKVSLFLAMRSLGMTKSRLADSLGWSKSQVSRLFNLSHGSSMETVDAVANELGQGFQIAFVSRSGLVQPDSMEVSSSALRLKRLMHRQSRLESGFDQLLKRVDLLFNRIDSIATRMGSVAPSPSVLAGSALRPTPIHGLAYPFPAVKEEGEEGDSLGAVAWGARQPVHQVLIETNYPDPASLQHQPKSRESQGIVRKASRRTQKKSK